MSLEKHSAELAKTRAHIFDIRKVKEFICWPRELKAKGTLKESP